MRRFIFLILIIFIAYVSKPYWEEFINLDAVSTNLESIKENPDVIAAMDSISDSLGTIIEQLDDTLKELQYKQSEQQEVKSPILNSPTDQKFSIYNIELGESKDEVEITIGAPKRVTQNEYGVDWYSYHDDYHNFLMVSYDNDDRVNGLYTNQDLISSTAGVQLGSSKESVKNYLGEPLTKIRKGLMYYQVQDNGEYQVFQVDNSFITVFYDQHENDTVTAIQIIHEGLEKNKKGIYSMPSQELKEGFEYQLFDLTNAARVRRHLGVLQWDDHVKETARNHSLDMAENHYFDHTNLQGKSPFDRMKEDRISFLVAGENLAYGQFSSIFAHEGLMNSLGHRENILKRDYTFLGVGVAFNSESQPYYTENFLRK